MAPTPLWPGSTVRAGGRTLYVRRAGNPEAPPAVMVHGLGGNSTNWTDLMGLLADRLDEHAPDLPGFGRSGPSPDGRYPLDLHVAAVAGYVLHLGRGPVHLFGNSLGGAVATRLAAEHPELVATLTLCSPALPQFGVRRAALDHRLGLLLVPGIAAMAERWRRANSPEQFARAVIELCVADPDSIAAERMAELAEEVERRRALPWSAPALIGSLRGLVASYVDPGSRNLWRQATRVAAPTLVVAGRRDRLVPLTVARRAGQAFGDVRVVVLDDVAHVPQIEQPETVAALVREHLDRYAPLRARRSAAG